MRIIRKVLLLAFGILFAPALVEVGLRIIPDSRHKFNFAKFQKDDYKEIEMTLKDLGIDYVDLHNHIKEEIRANLKKEADDEIHLSADQKIRH